MEKEQLNYVIITSPNLWRNFFKIQITKQDRAKLAAKLIGVLGACMVDFINPKEWKDIENCDSFCKNSFGYNLKKLEKVSIEIPFEFFK